MVKISVIIPVYNVEDYLNECLDSIVNQSFEDIEIICVNDGSTDNSLNILESYRDNDSRFKIITQKNKGQGAARNIGLDNAEGDYIYFMDGDDYLEPDSLRIIYEISEKKNLDLLMFKLINFNEKTGEKDYNYSDMQFLEKLDDVFTYRDFKHDLFRADVTVYTKLFKRELIADKRFNEDLLFEDNLFYINYILDAKRILFYNKCLYNRRIRDNSIISKGSERYSDVIIIFNAIEEILKENDEYDNVKEELFNAKLYACHNRYSLVNPIYKDSFFKLLKNDLTVKKDQYNSELDFEKIENFPKIIYQNILKYNNAETLDLSVENYKLKNRINKLKKENRKLKNNTFSSKIKKWSPF